MNTNKLALDALNKALIEEETIHSTLPPPTGSYTEWWNWNQRRVEALKTGINKSIAALEAVQTAKPTAIVCDCEGAVDDDGRPLHYALLYLDHPLPPGVELYATPQPAVRVEPVHCPDCPDQGWYEIETGGVGPDGENDTRQCEQVQCEFCYMTPNSVFNSAQAAVQVEPRLEVPPWPTPYRREPTKEEPYVISLFTGEQMLDFAGQAAARATKFYRAIAAQQEAVPATDDHLQVINAELVKALQKYVDHFGDPLQCARAALAKVAA